MNVVVLRGRLSRPPEPLTLSSGELVVTYDVVVARAGERTENVPVVWPAPPPAALELQAEAEVVVTGRVRKRFFRVGGGTQSRTEVVADGVVPARQVKRAARLVAAACATVRGEVEPVP